MAANGEVESDSPVRSSAEEGRRGAILAMKMAQASRRVPEESRRRNWQLQRTEAREARAAEGAESLEEDEVGEGSDEEPSPPL
jgi:hypothetical protein